MQELLPHLFRTEYRKIVSVLGSRFGLSHLEAAEDLASDTFLSAALTWPVRGIPDNPVAWLHEVARNKARNLIKREGILVNKLLPELRGASAEEPETDIDLSPQNIHDSQLRMMFAICQPLLNEEAQIALSLRILCGFGITEIADAFLVSRDVISKRLQRAREKLRTAGIDLTAFRPEGAAERLPAVLQTLYLLFSEGYYSESNDLTLRKDLCAEAIRLCLMLTENPGTDTPEAQALLALMCFHASRFGARTDADGLPVLYEDQDVTLWDADLIARGAYALHVASRGDRMSKYHLEAAIAYWHTQRPDTVEKWSQVLQLYDKLLALTASDIVALNRIYALYKVKGPQPALTELKPLPLQHNPLYWCLLGEITASIHPHQARAHFQQALSLARTASERRTLERRIERLVVDGW